MSANPDDLPMSTSVQVLGAQIRVWHQNTYTHIYTGHTTRETAVTVDAYGSDRKYDDRSRRDLAAWARRNLFRVDMSRDDGDETEVPA